MNALLSVWNPILGRKTFEQAQKVLIKNGELLWLVVHDRRYPHARHLAQTFSDGLKQLKRKLEGGDSSNLFLYPRDFHSGDYFHGELIGIEENIDRSLLEDPRVPEYLKAGGSWKIGWAFRLKSLSKISPQLFKHATPLVAPNFGIWGSYGRPFPGPAQFNAEVELRQELLAPTDEFQVGGLRCSPDFRSANLHGATYYFTLGQAQVIEILFLALKSGAPGLGDAYIMSRFGNPDGRIRDIFKGDPSLGTLVLKERQGVYRLKTE